MTLSERISRLGWYLRQLVPTTYRTRYVDDAGLRHFTVWRMWLGRSFDVDDVVVGLKSTGKASERAARWHAFRQLAEISE